MTLGTLQQALNGYAWRQCVCCDVNAKLHAKLVNKKDKMMMRHAETTKQKQKHIIGVEKQTTQTSDVSDVGLLMEADENGLCFGSAVALVDVGVGVLR